MQAMFGGALKRIKSNGALHRAHLWADAAIGAVAVIGIFWDDAFKVFVQADLAFHITIAALAFGGILAERLLHRHKHSGVVGY